MKCKYIACIAAGILVTVLISTAVPSDSGCCNSMVLKNAGVVSITKIADKKGCRDMYLRTQRLRYNRSEVYSQNNIYLYLSSEENRKKVMKRALQLNNGQYVNACVYFAAEVLRQNRVFIPDTVSRTMELTAQLKNKGWVEYKDYRQLQPGDICFTTDIYGGSGSPSHTYVFMNWISPGNYNYAMVCDNQEDRYGTIYHVRNIAKPDVYNGEKKEAFGFFLRK